ncbi:MAG: hypothetical protein JWP97_5636 [Labilithrix sp.]|nr:hypothetical protein [Labilithrix sp.]
MAGTRKLEKFDVEGTPSAASGTRRLEKFDLFAVRPRLDLSMATPLEPISLETLAAALPSVPPAGPAAEDEEAPAAVVSTAPRALDREPDVERLRTQLARKFTTVADEVTAKLSELQIGAGAWQPELTAPEGMSTRSGSKGALHLRLRPKRQGHHVLVGGFVDAHAKTADLRTYAAMIAAHQQRFGDEVAMGFSDGEWEQFLRRAEVVLRAAGIQATRRAPSAHDVARVRRRRPRVSRTTLAAAALGFLAPSALLVLWRVLTILWR